MSRSKILLEMEIKARATSLGFSVCGITSPDLLEYHPEYVNWLQRGLHADMQYLSSPFHVSKRQNPEKLLPGLKSIIVLGLSYSLHQQAQIEGKPLGVISGYASGEDYHMRIPRMAAPLLEFITSLDPHAPAPRVFADSAPVLERELAVRAGLGWIGRNSCLISPTHGSNILLAEVFTGIPLEPDSPFLKEYCGSCQRCIEACPTGCILAERKIDANRCLSYHSIENRGIIPPAMLDKFGYWIFGCDTCQMVCPWNHHSLAAAGSTGAANLLTLEEMLAFLDFSPQDFINNVGGTAMARARYSGILRNIIIRLAGLNEMRAIPSLKRIESLPDQSMLQETAKWAKEKMLTG